jgi:hypothetical protein
MNALIYFLIDLDPTINREILRTASFMEWFLVNFVKSYKMKKI